MKTFRFDFEWEGEDYTAHGYVEDVGRGYWQYGSDSGFESCPQFELDWVEDDQGAIVEVPNEMSNYIDRISTEKMREPYYD